MKAFCKVAGMTSMLLLLAFGLLYSTRTVSARGRRQDHRNGKT